VYGSVLTEAVGVYARSVDAAELARLEAMAVPEADRASGKFAGVSLTIKVLALHEKFRFVHSGGN
jgi:hypothetical protein